MADLNKVELQSKMIMLTEKYEKQIKEKDKQIIECKELIAKLEKELNGIKLASTIVSSDDDKIKKILSFHAQLLSITDIYEKMKYLGFTVYVQEIENIINNIDCLSAELQEYFKKEEKAFNDAILIDNNAIKATLHARYSRLLSSIEKDLLEQNNSDDIQLKINLRKEYKDVLNAISSFSKNIDDREVANETNSLISDMESEYEETKSNVFKFDKSILDDMIVV